MTLKHTTVVATADDGTSEVGSNEWNADHAISGTSLALQYNNAGSLSEMAGTSWDNTNRTLFFTGSTNAVAVLGSASADIFWTASVTPALQVQGTAAASASAVVAKYANTQSGSLFIMGHSRAASLGGRTIVQDGDWLGNIQWQGTDGVDFQVATVIRGEVDGAPGLSSMPGRLIFMTTNTGSVTSTEKFRIDHAGVFYFGGGDIAAPTAQTTQAVSVVAGTSNTAGVDWNIVGSKGTGTGAGGAIVFKTAAAGTTGTTQNTAAEVLRIASTSAVTITEQAGASALTLTGSTQTTSNPVLSLTQTWNAGGVTFTGIKLNVTNTASAATSLLQEWQVGGTGQAGIVQAGGVYSTNGFWSTQAHSWAGPAFVLGMHFTDTGSTTSVMDFWSSSVSSALTFSDAILSGRSTFVFGWTSATNGNPSNKDTGLARPAAALVEINTGTAAGVGYLRLNGVAVASLPAASATYAGARGTVTNANSNTFNASVVAATSTSTAQIVPVFCDGAAWKIG